MRELVCPEHGPYDASFGSCPYCRGQAGGPPVRPNPLDDDDMPTQVGGGSVYPGGGYGPSGEDDVRTDLGPDYAHRGGPGFLDKDDLIETDLGRGPLDDETELDYDQVDTGPMALLWVKEGPRRGRVYRIKDGSIVARRDGDLILDDPRVSNPHARFRINDDGKFVVWDFGSRNGTYVNGDRIEAATVLNEGDEIKIGETLFVVKIME